MYVQKIQSSKESYNIRMWEHTIHSFGKRFSFLFYSNFFRVGEMIKYNNVTTIKSIKLKLLPFTGSSQLLLPCGLYTKQRFVLSSSFIQQFSFFFKFIFVYSFNFYTVLTSLITVMLRIRSLYETYERFYFFLMF